MSDTSIELGKPIFPGLANLYQPFSRYGYALMRFGVGAVLVPHGLRNLLFGAMGGTADVIALQTGLSSTGAWATVAALVQLLGGACLAIGFLTRPAAFLVWLYMTVNILFFHWQNGYFWTQGGIEYPLLSWVLCIAIILKGGGRCSIDRAIGREI